MLLAYADRTRVIPDEYRRAVFLSNGRVRGTFLIGGRVPAPGRSEKGKRAATLVVEPFTQIARKDRAALTDEGQRLIAFLEEEAGARSVRFARAD